MSVTLRCTTGTINYTDYLHVTAAKVLAPGAPVWETWIPVPITNYNFIIPGLDPENYIISFYDAPTNVAVGTLRLQLIANALTNEFIYEKRFYKCGRGGVGDPAPGDNKIIDPYFTGKLVTSGFQETFRFLEPLTEWQMSTTTTTEDTFELLNGHSFDIDEVISIDIKLASGILAATSGSFYTGRVDVTDAVYNVQPLNKGKRHRLLGTISTQLLNLPSLGIMGEENAFLFDNTCGGVSRQVKLQCFGTDVVKYNGFKNGSVNITTITEFWVDRGDMIMIAKVDDNWEVILPYKGINVGEHFMGTFRDHPNTVIEDGQIGEVALDGDELPKLFWWVTNVLPASHKISDATVDSPAYVHPDGKQGMFVVHPDPLVKKFRTGNWQNFSERALKDFNNYGTDPDRGAAGINDYPGGKQPAQVGEFSTVIPMPKGNSYTGGPNILRMGNGSNTPQNFDLPFTANVGKTNTVTNLGVIALRRI